MRALTKILLWPLLVALSLAGGSFLGAYALGGRGAREHVVASEPHAAPKDRLPAAATTAPLESAADLSRTFRAIHDSLADAVVNIDVTISGDAAMPERLRNMLPMLPPQMQNELRDEFDQRAQGTGSGVIVTADGYILTNNHVVGGASDITVTLNDGRVLKAQRVGTDPKSDLAVIRIPADHLSFATFGDSDKLKVGDWVLAFGSPFGLSQTMTQGIISAVGRHVPIIADHDPSLRGMAYESFLQTDAAINPGNSGGPLVNLHGEIVGVNAALASETGSYNGIGFSIPSNDARFVMRSLIDNGKVVRGYVGMIIEDFHHPSPEHKLFADALLKEGATTGVLVGKVTANGPAAKAGLKPGDLITALDGQPVSDVDILRNQIARTRPESTITITCFRDSKSQDFMVTIGAQPDAAQAATQSAFSRYRPQANPIVTALGVSVCDIDAGTAQVRGLSPNQGVLVRAITSGSPFAPFGIKPGDVIIRVNKTEITSAGQFADVLKAASLPEGIQLTVRNDGVDNMVFVRQN